MLWQELPSTFWLINEIMKQLRNKAGKAEPRSLPLENTVSHTLWNSSVLAQAKGRKAASFWELL